MNYCYSYVSKSVQSKRIKINMKLLKTEICLQAYTLDKI